MWPASSALHAATLDLEILCGRKDEVLAGGLRPVVQAQIPSDLRRSDIKVTVYLKRFCGGKIFQITHVIFKLFPIKK